MAQTKSQQILIIRVIYGSYMTDWVSTKIPKKMYDKIEKFLKSNEGKELGYNSKSDFIVQAARELLEKHDKPRFQHFNLQDNIIRLIDDELPSGKDIVEIRLNKNKLRCGHCSLMDCVHIEAVWNFSDIANKLTKKGVQR